MGWARQRRMPIYSSPAIFPSSIWKLSSNFNWCQLRGNGREISGPERNFYCHHRTIGYGFHWWIWPNFSITLTKALEAWVKDWKRRLSLFLPCLSKGFFLKTLTLVIAKCSAIKFFFGNFTAPSPVVCATWMSLQPEKVFWHLCVSLIHLYCENSSKNSCCNMLDLMSGQAKPDNTITGII